jgi:2,4-dienoyl-CoA reductase-like NADH-dependent reductase (Old Yellow Enzyme family)
MDRDDIRRVIQAMLRRAAARLMQAFDICEIHGAHGYVIQQGSLSHHQSTVTTATAAISPAACGSVSK